LLPNSNFTSLAATGIYKVEPQALNLLMELAAQPDFHFAVSDGGHFSGLS